MTRKPYDCSQCPKSFHTRDGLDEHFRNRHQNKIKRPSESENFIYQKFEVGTDE